MNYINTPFPYGDHNIGQFDTPIGYGVPSLAQCGPPADPYSTAYPPHEFHPFPGFYGHSGPFGDYDEYVENLSRPRLTKEQVETLEAQFQAHPKPNSNVKRQLAVQTNLTLPRVANWFQNRRAKAKQQKRQEEFERMQAIKGAENLKNENSWPPSDANRGCQTAKTSDEDSESSLKHTQVQGPTTQQGSTFDSEPSGNQPKPFRLPIIEEASSSNLGSSTALGTSDETRTAGETSKGNSRSALGGRLSNNDDNDLSTGIANMTEPAPLIWPTSSQHRDAFSTETIDIGRHTSPQQITGIDSSGLWAEGSDTVDQPVFHLSYSACEGRSQLSDGSLYSNDEPFLQPFLTTQMSSVGTTELIGQRRESCSSAEMDRIGHASLHGSISVTKESVNGLQDPHISSPVGNTFSRRRDKKLDLAARRKQPRPAAIGISGPSRSLTGPSSMSPTTRVPAWGASQSLRHVKSSQTLGSSLSPRYAGVRKISAPLRSPLGAAASLDFTGASSSEFIVPPLVTTSMAPPTPLTPEDLQYLLPPTPIDAHYCLSPTDEMRCTRLFPMSQSMDSQSPPRTPHHPHNLSQFRYFPSHPPLSTCLSTTYENYPPSIAHDSMLPGSWAQATFVSEDISPPDIHMRKPTHFHPVAQNSNLVAPAIAVGEDWSAEFTPSVSALSQPVAVSVARKINAEFMIEKFPNQQEAHRLAAQHLSLERPKNYTFANHTPNDF